MSGPYVCQAPGRVNALRNAELASPPLFLNGIRYLEVAPGQRRLGLHFVHPLDLVPAVPLQPINVEIRGGRRVRDPQVTGVTSTGDVLWVDVATTGDFSIYTLRLVANAGSAAPPAGIDPALAQTDFRFKVDCPSDFDCKPMDHCEPKPAVGPVIDYLARDYTSFRRLMLDRLAALMPNWRERNPADLWVTLAEAVAFRGDELSYYQDAVATESYLGTARQRVSMRRHTRLLDYALHDGCNARTWIAFNVGAAADGLTLPGCDTRTGLAGTQLFTRVPGLPLCIDVDGAQTALEAGAQPFELLAPLTLYTAHNAIGFHTWSDDECCLPHGATRAFLRDDDANRLRLGAGDVLVLEAKKATTTGETSDADAQQRTAVRLTRVDPEAPVVDGVRGTPAVRRDPVTGQAFVEVEWSDGDALPFALCLSKRIGGELITEMAGACANVGLADHGGTAPRIDPLTALPGGRVPRYPLDRTALAPLTQQGRVRVVGSDAMSLVDVTASAASAMVRDLADVRPAIDVRSEGDLRRWTARRDLLASDSEAAEFVVETENDGRAVLRFGDGVNGRSPPAEGLRARLRIGNGVAGNIGAEAIGHIVANGIIAVRNPMAAQGGTDPHPASEARLYAPQAFRRQERAVTEKDYGAMMEREPRLQRAVATRRWTGSWYTMFITVDRRSAESINAQFENELRAFIERYRLAGHDIEIDAPISAPLDIELHACAKPGYFASDVEQRLLDVFSAGRLPNGGTGFFHPDRFTFGQPVYLSAVVAAAMAVPGVAYVTPLRFQRLGRKSADEIASGRIRIARLEIARLDNDPNSPENGRLRFVIDTGGGRMNAGASIDACGCCESAAEPAPVRNDPGLPALRYRVDTQPGFYARMLESLPLAPANARKPNSPRPLSRLLSRSTDDPTVAFVDASACVADVLTFYEERIANEGFLRTATERRSVLELARAIGYELKPGVAASVYLSFTVEDAPGSPRICTLAAGTPVQSVPSQGKLPQVFETSADLVAHAEWNALAPRQLRPADMAIIDVTKDDGTTSKALALLGSSGSFPSGTLRLQQGLISNDLFRLDPGIAADQSVDAIEVGRVYFADATASITVGDLLLFVGKRGSDLVKLVLRAVAVVPEVTLKRVRVDLEALPDPVKPLPPPTFAWSTPYAIKPNFTFAKPQVATVDFTSTAIAATVTKQAWHEGDLKAMIGIQGWSDTNLVKAIATPPSGPPIAPEAGAFAFSAKLSFFGNNAPKWGILPNGTNINQNPYKAGWDVGDGDGADPAGTLSASRTIWMDSQGNPIAPSAYLERAVAGVSRGGWTVFDAPEANPEVYGVFDTREVSRADYGISGRAMALTLASDSGTPTKPSTPSFSFRSTTAYLASKKLTLADLPIETPLAAGATSIELDRMVLGLAIGQPIALTGKRYDVPGVDAAEVALLADIIHADGRSTLVLQEGLSYSYVRGGLTINANVTRATHGETVNEVLGNGDASIANQAFVLKKPPTTFLSVPTASGVANTLEVRVNGVRWDEVASLYGASPDQTVYTTRIDNDAKMQVTFGDGVRGARLPTGSVNVAARYRSGIGPDGEVGAGSLTMLRAMPLGLRGVTNSIAASGAEGPEKLADARRNAPLTLLTFERVVSLLDYENYARAYPGMGKARGDVLWIDGAARVHLTVAGATGGPPGADVLDNLRKSIASASDPSQRFSAAAYAPRFFNLAASIAVDPRFRVKEVQTSVTSALLAAFGFEARDLGQSVTAAEVMALVHTVPGVISIDIVDLLPLAVDAPAAGTTLDAVPAFAARYEVASSTTLPAELLLINPAGITLTEMKP